MSANIRQLIDDENNAVYPVTKASATYLSNGTDTVERVLNDSMDQDTEIKFEGKTVTKTLASGTVITTRFMDSGEIVEITTTKDGVVLEKKTTTFNEDGSINIKIGD